MPRVLDISPRISPELAVWPGDVPFSRQVALDLDRGDNLTLSAITATVHLGAHADAPSHYLRGGEAIADRDPARYLGRCQVAHVTAGPGERLKPAHLPPITAPRLLLRTGSYPDPRVFERGFVSLSPELVAFVHDRGVRLVGLDTPSIDPFDDAELHSHAAVAARDMAVLEGLVLERVPEGEYLLVALPLPIEGADASPVRAVLVADVPGLRSWS